MKTKVLSLFVMLLMATTVVFAANKTEKFAVKGLCGMCENRIEKAALSVEGVSKADWDRETQKIEVVFDDEVTQLDAVHKAIAKAGHDTKKHKAKDEVYEKLPGCCKYDRTETKKEEKGHEGHNH
ncbi:heavy-metal-associated domain-containing protein [Geofilum rubicundum]|nr:heavy metal-associated domain-containing protein [Geofilum rubicundum]